MAMAFFSYKSRMFLHPSDNLDAREHACMLVSYGTTWAEEGVVS